MSTIKRFISLIIATVMIAVTPTAVFASDAKESLETEDLIRRV